ncbi:MAG: hypothetical protein ACRDS1_04850 [Pseudonocardiaceae bacterium]
MSTGNGNGTEFPAAAAGARPVVLLRYRPGVTGQTARTVHLMPLPEGGQTGAAGVALCGVMLCPDQVEMVAPGHSAPCSLCVIGHVRASPPPTSGSTPTAEQPPDDATRPHPTALSYQTWGWPVTLRRNQVWLTLEPDTMALIIPTLLAAEATAILAARRCSPPVLAHPNTPEHRVLLAREPYGVDLPWPPGVHRVTEPLPLPPHSDPTWTGHLGVPTPVRRTTAVPRNRRVRRAAHRATQRPIRRP